MSIVYCLLCTVYCILSTVYDLLYTVYCILYTVYWLALSCSYLDYLAIPRESFVDFDIPSQGVQPTNDKQHPKYRASPDFGLTGWNWEICRSAKIPKGHCYTFRCFYLWAMFSLKLQNYEPLLWGGFVYPFFPLFSDFNGVIFSFFGLGCFYPRTLWEAERSAMWWYIWLSTCSLWGQGLQ